MTFLYIVEENVEVRQYKKVLKIMVIKRVISIAIIIG
jgi:hypothetical protein